LKKSGEWRVERGKSGRGKKRAEGRGKDSWGCEFFSVVFWVPFIPIWIGRAKPKKYRTASWNKNFDPIAVLLSPVDCPKYEIIRTRHGTTPSPLWRGHPSLLRRGAGKKDPLFKTAALQDFYSA
jgi:hypothetical protein